MLSTDNTAVNTTYKVPTTVELWCSGGVKQINPRASGMIMRYDAKT